MASHIGDEHFKVPLVEFHLNKATVQPGIMLYLAAYRIGHRGRFPVKVGTVHWLTRIVRIEADYTTIYRLESSIAIAYYHTISGCEWHSATQLEQQPYLRAAARIGAVQITGNIRCLVHLWLLRVVGSTQRLLKLIYLYYKTIKKSTPKPVVSISTQLTRVPNFGYN